MAKRNGQKSGLALRSKAEVRRVVALGMAACQKAADERAEAYRLHIEWAFRQPGVYGTGRPISFRGYSNVFLRRMTQALNFMADWGLGWRLSKI